MQDLNAQEENIDSAAVTSEAENQKEIEQVRELLFGSQQKAIANHFQLVEQQVQQLERTHAEAMMRLQNEHNAQLARLEDRHRQSLREVGEAIKSLGEHVLRIAQTLHLPTDGDADASPSA